MGSLAKSLNSSIGQKVTMSLTGLFLCIFLVIHLTGNFQLFKNDNGLAFNEYAVFMTTFPPITFISYGLYAMILYHAFKGLALAYNNQKARPVKYAYNNPSKNSHWTSRNMGVLGTILLVFIAAHMSNFWFEYKFGFTPYAKYEINTSNNQLISFSEYGKELEVKKQEFTVGESTKVVIIKDLYKEVSEDFKVWWIALFYVVSMGAVAFHLYHGFQSAFQTLGINHNRYITAIRFVGLWVFSIIIPIGFAAMPIYFYAKQFI